MKPLTHAAPDRLNSSLLSDISENAAFPYFLLGADQAARTERIEATQRRLDTVQGLDLLAPLRFAHRLLAAQLAMVAAKATPELVLYEASGIVQLPNNRQVDLSRRGPMRLLVGYAA